METDVLPTELLPYFKKSYDNTPLRQTLITTLREIHGAVDEADPSSSGILEDYTQRLEQQSWFLSAQNYSA